MLEPPAPRSAQAFSSKRREIGNEVGLPHVAARPHRDEIALAGEEAGRALPIDERGAVVEHERLVVEQVEHGRQVVGRAQPRALAAAGIEMLVAAVERQREQALRPPFEAMLPAIAGLDHGAAVAGQHVHHLLVDVLLRIGLAARRKVEHEHGDEVAAALQMYDAAIGAHARPRR